MTAITQCRKDWFGRKWNPVSYEVMFVDAEDVNMVYDTQNVVRNGKVEEFISQNRADIFKGWYTDQECQSAFDYAAQIRESYYLRKMAAVHRLLTYNVKHQTADGTLIKEEAPKKRKGRSNCNCRSDYTCRSICRICAGCHQ